ncbi:MAG: rhomboid family intramembrane serine protease [Bacteroidota bacterium]
MTPWVTRLIIANVAMFVVSKTLPTVSAALILVPALVPSRPWTLITYMFLHGGLGHIFFNMLALYFFGPRLEVQLGGRQFIWLYLISGLMGAMLSFVFTPFAAIVGASGAVFGVLLGFARHWPREPIYIWGLFPVEARWLVVIMTALALWGGFGGTAGGIAHFAHLGGFLGGFLYLRWLERTSRAGEFRAKVSGPSPRSTDLQRWEKIRREGMHEVNRAELDRVLDKINATGVESLTPEERAFLDRFSPE